VTRVFSGIQPTGDLHLGNHLGALVNWVGFQDRAECVYCVVDLHAITSPAEHDPSTLRQRTLETATLLLAVGIDPARSILLVQSHLHEHAECTWLFNCVAGFGELRKMPQFKEKSEGRGESVSVGLFDYPVLQAADILLYHADEVPVGEDQRHHIELARDIGQRFNHRFGEEVFTLPKAIHPPAAARVMDLQEPTNKMSKSTSSDKGIINLLDDPKVSAKKIKSAVTDTGTEIRFDEAEKPGISNLLTIYATLTGTGIAELEQKYEGKGYGALKTDLAEVMVEWVTPFRVRTQEYLDDPETLDSILAKGAEKARTVAAETLAQAYDKVGFLPAKH
jgi:tryptophanyl-tRNA synthetase